MTTITEIEDAIRALPEEDLALFSSWFERYEEDRWDRQLERDQRSGPLRDLAEKARADFVAGKYTRL